MNRLRHLAATVVVLTLIGLATLAATLEEADQTYVAAAQPITTTTGEPDFAALVESAVSPTLPEQERRLTDEAVARVTSTTTSSTTTTTSTTVASTTATPPAASAPTTAAPSPAPPQTSPSTTSPPTTSPPTTSPPTTAAGGFVAGAESDFASRINSYRAANGLPALSRDGSLNSYARNWAERLAANGGLSHSNLSALIPPWSGAGENVGVGGSVGAIFDALVASSGHATNMRGEFTHMGIGVYRDASGALWTAHVFTR